MPPFVSAGLVDGEDIGSHGRPSAMAAPKLETAEPGTPAAPRSRERTDAEICQSIVGKLRGLGRDDLLRVDAIVSELPYTVLLARCQAATREGVEPEGTPNFRTGPTSRRTSALAQLLGAMDAIGALVGLPPRRRTGVGTYLRPAAEERS